MPSNQFHRVEKLVGQCEDWKDVATYAVSGFNNSWVNYSAGWDEAAFYKDPFNVVHIKGLVKSGTLDANIFVLPEGYRPARNQMFSVIDGSNSAVRLQVLSTGGVLTNGASNSGYQSLWCSFRV